MSASEQALGRPAIEVVAKAKRRQFTGEYKRKIVREADGCKTPGAIGALLRREGLYSSHLTTWRAARERGELAGAPKKRGCRELPDAVRARDPHGVLQRAARAAAEEDPGHRRGGAPAGVLARLGEPGEKPPTDWATLTVTA